MSITQKLNDAPTFYNVNPPIRDTTRVLAKYRYLIDQGVTKAAVVYVEQGANEAVAQRELMKSAGIEVVLDRAFPVTTLSYDSLARAVANSGADYMYFLHEFGASASMARAIADTGHPLKFKEYVTAHGTDFVDLAGDAGEGSTNWLFALPVEDGGAVPAQADFIEWMQRTAPGVQIDTFATQGWSATKAILDTLEGLPGPISRNAMLDALATTGRYDGEGLLGPIDLGGKRTEGCLVAVIVRNGSWTRLTPSSGFLC